MARVKRIKLIILRLIFSLFSNRISKIKYVHFSLRVRMGHVNTYLSSFHIVFSSSILINFSIYHQLLSTAVCNLWMKKSDL